MHRIPIGIYRTQTDLFVNNRRREFEPMVQSGRPGLHHRGFGHGVGHGTGSRIPLLGSCAKKVGTLTDLGLHGILLSHHIPMVLLGLFSGLQPVCYQRLHWRSQEVWSHEDSRCS